MFEDFKNQVKMYNDKPNKTLKPTKLTQKEKDVEKLKQTSVEFDHVTLEQLLPECLDSEGIDRSLLSGAEWDILILLTQNHQYFLEQYPQTKEEAKLLGKAWVEAAEASVQMNIELAKADPRGKMFFELMCKLKAIYDKIEVLQSQASDYEKLCLRLYWHIVPNRYGPSNSKPFRTLLHDEDVFEAVEAYFKICKKYKVPIFEEPYCFLSDQQRHEVKLVGDVLRRTTGYDDFEIRVSILEALV